MKVGESQPGQPISAKSMRSHLAIVFCVVFVDLVGFGIVIPLGPYLAREFQASNFEIGLLMSIYSLMQFLFSPVWGSLSDRIGRRPVILISLLGASLSYFAFAFSSSLAMLFVSRALAGAFGGNISAAHAAIADLSSPENRSKNMGLIGAAFGLGFIFGPVIGAGLGAIGMQLGSAPPFGISFAAIGAAGICFANFVAAYFILRETLAPEHRAKKGGLKPSRIVTILSHIRKPVVGPLMTVYFLTGLAMAQMESMLFVFVDEKFGWGFKTASLGFAYIGVLMVLTQGIFIRKWMPKFGERKILNAGLILFSLGLFAIPVFGSIPMFAILMTAFAFGNGLMRPPNLGLISLATPPNEQGSVMGVTNSLAALGRIVGPAAGGYFYSAIGPGSPFYIAGALGVCAWLLALSQFKHLTTDAGRKEQAHA